MTEVGEAPLYVLKPKKSRILVPNGIKLLLLSIAFYVGVLINVNLLNLAIPSYINILIIVILVLLIGIESILTFVRLSRIQYTFFQTRMQVSGPKEQYVMFSNIQTASSSQSFFDKLFGTGTIIIGTYKMKAMPNVPQNLQYVQSLIQASKGQYYQ